MFQTAVHDTELKTTADCHSGADSRGRRRGTLNIEHRTLNVGREIKSMSLRVGSSMLDVIALCSSAALR